jgi:hypothetical protein
MCVLMQELRRIYEIKWTRYGHTDSLALRSWKSTRYLGIPLTLLKPTHAEEQPLIDKIAARILTWKARLLNHAGRATLTKVTLSAILIHVSIASELSSWALR